MYLEFSKYKDTGGKLSELKFYRGAMTACSKIDDMTFNRLRAFFYTLPIDDPLRKKVEYLVFELIECELIGSLDGREISSASNDGRSMSFESNTGKAEGLIRSYLGNEKDRLDVPLLYAGAV
jgi:hypothetical protein